MEREQILNLIKEKGAKAVFVRDFPHLDEDGNAVRVSIIRFKPKVFGKSSRKSVIEELGLKTKEDCDKLNDELASMN